jgi:hypothetical protein
MASFIVFILSINCAGPGVHGSLDLRTCPRKDNNAVNGTRQLVPLIKGQNDLYSDGSGFVSSLDCTTGVFGVLAEPTC